LGRRREYLETRQAVGFVVLPIAAILVYALAYVYENLTR
jgi:hypothetical protein